MSPPNVRVLHDGSWHHPGGGARVAKHLAKALNASVTVGHCADPSFWLDDPDVEAEIAFQNQLHGGVGGRLPGPAKELRLGQLFRSLELEEDIIVSSGTAAKWIIPEAHQHHVHYCHVPPPRFYGEGQGVSNPVVWGLRQFGGMADQHFASFVDEWLTNSEWTRQRVRKHYNAEAAVLNPPVRTERFSWMPPSGDRYFVMIGRLVEMKRPDVVAEAFGKGELGAKLVLIGDGPLRQECESYDNVSVYTDVNDWGVELTVGRAVGGIALAEGEHCGITPKEMQAAGKPVVVPDEQNLCNHVVDGETGVVVDPTPDGVREGVSRVLDAEWSRDGLQTAASSWSVGMFHRRARGLVLPDEDGGGADASNVSVEPTTSVIDTQIDD